MNKQRIIFFCKECGNESLKWLGKCPACGAWNSFIEQKLNDGEVKLENRDTKKPIKLQEITEGEITRIDTKSVELNRVLGGGIVPGSVILIAGEPGIGKSTLMLQFALRVKSIKTLYVSGEESEYQLKLRAERLKGKGESCLILCDTIVENIITAISEIKPDIVVIDSIQTIQTDNYESYPGSVSQIKQCAFLLMQTAKQMNIPIFIIGHVNKEGDIAGPKIIEHMVDVVLFFEGNTNNTYRLLRTMKNRFGPTFEIGLFDMRQDGLKEVTNPTNVLINEETFNLSGTCLACVIEGIRPLIVEVQALVNQVNHFNPQRVSNGYDNKRLAILIAVIEKILKIKFYNKEIFINIAGGFKINDTSLDFAVAMAMLSSTYDLTIPRELCFIGEIGLNGEIRPSPKIEQRLNEIQKIGIKHVVVSSFKIKELNMANFKNLNIIPVSNISEIKLKELISEIKC
ncbi:MAG: DNA repair protein RadA [Bacteroidales bacterium]|nr:DNA repair protein RadA [Bacteroidales bacterium]